MDTLLHDANFWLGISFIIFAFILWKKGKAGLLNAIDTRILDIRKHIETAESLRTEAERLLSEYRQKHNDAVRESRDILVHAEKQVEQMRLQAEADLAEMVQRREQQLQERLARMEQNARQAIQKHAAELAMEATARIIAERLGQKGHEKLVDQAIKDIPDNLH